MPTNTTTALTVIEPVALPPGVPPPSSSGLNFHDLLFILYRHKIKILLFLLVGLAAAGVVYFFLPAPFESTSKLLVRYVVDRSMDGVVGGAKGEESAVGSPNEAVLNSEVEILTSSDLAKQVVETIGLDRLEKAAGKKLTVEDATINLRKATIVEALKGTNIILVTYHNKDPKLAVEVLDQIISRYLEKHLEVHRSVAGFEFVNREADRLKVELTKTEDTLKTLKEKYSVTSMTEAVKATGEELNKAQADFDTTQADLATQKAHVAEIDKFFHGEELTNQKSGVAVPVPPDAEIVNRYQGLVGKLEILRKTQAELLGRYTANSTMVKGKQAKLDELEKQKVALERKYPALITTVAAAAGGSNNSALTSANEIILERARLAGLETRSTELQGHVLTLVNRTRDLNEIAPKIAELERTRDVEETNYRYYASSLEKARVDAGLNPSRMPNINIVQNPSPAVRATKDIKKIVIGLIGGALVGGFGLAFFLELVLDKTIKRSRELESRLHLPLMLAIPVLAGRDGHLHLTDHNGDGEEDSALAETEIDRTGVLLRPFCEAIRDRLSFDFGMNNMTHKPKLVAVTGLSKSAGVSSLAAGLANAFSEGEETNKVLLVDKPASPKRFYDMLSGFKTSSLDYVIFDMPSVGDLTSTLPMAGFMDKVLLVVEAQKSGREAVKKAYTQLAAKGTDVSVVFNKSRTYGPKWLEGEL